MYIVLTDFVRVRSRAVSKELLASLTKFNLTYDLFDADICVLISVYIYAVYK